MQGESWLGLHPYSPLPPPELGLVLFDVPAEGGGRGTDPRSGPTTRYSLPPKPCRVATRLSVVAPGDQDGGRSDLELQGGQVSKKSAKGVGIECSLESPYQGSGGGTAVPGKRGGRVVYPGLGWGSGSELRPLCSDLGSASCW